MTRPVFLSDGLSADPAGLEAGARARLGGDEGRHAAQVRRIGAGEWVDVVDGRGRRLVCEVVGASKTGLDLVVASAVDEAVPAVRTVLVQALAKGGHDEQAVDVCTQIGVGAVVPWASERAVVRWSGPRALKGRAKWQGVARAAAKQARRAFVPEVGEPLDTRGLLGWVGRLVEAGGAALVCHEEASAGIGSVLEGLRADSPGGRLPGRVAVVVGPEGGISPGESEALAGAGAVLVGVGPTVLRSSTAGAVALALVLAAAGQYR